MERLIGIIIFILLNACVKLSPGALVNSVPSSPIYALSTTATGTYAFLCNTPNTILPLSGENLNNANSYTICPSNTASQVNSSILVMSGNTMGFEQNICIFPANLHSNGLGYPILSSASSNSLLNSATNANQPVSLIYLYTCTTIIAGQAQVTLALPDASYNAVFIVAQDQLTEMPGCFDQASICPNFSFGQFR